MLPPRDRGKIKLTKKTYVAGERQVAIERRMTPVTRLQNSCSTLL